MPTLQTSHQTPADEQVEGWRIDIEDAVSDRPHLPRPGSTPVTVLVLSSAAVFMMIVAVGLALWTGTSRETHLVDTSDCRMIEAAVPAELLEPSSCIESVTSTGGTPIGSVSEGRITARSLQLPVPVPGMWVQDALRSLE